MSRSFEPMSLDGVVLVSPQVHGDERGFFVERFKHDEYERRGIGPFVQDNHSRSSRGVLRGIHWQLWGDAQGKLVSVVRGEIFDVAVDLRKGSPTFGDWVGARLDDRLHRQMWVPPGFGHGFLVLSEVADVLYKTTSTYAPDSERGLRWNDPEVAIDWPGLDGAVRDGNGPDPREGDRDALPIVSTRDAALPYLADLAPDDLFAYRPEGSSL